MEISNLTLRRKNWKIFQEKLLLPWVRDMHYKKGRKEKEKRRKRKKNQSKIKEKQQKIEKKNKMGSFDQTISEQCVHFPREKI